MAVVDHRFRATTFLALGTGERRPVLGSHVNCIRLCSRRLGAEVTRQRGVTMWVYRQTDKQVWAVGFYAPDGEWIAESDHDDPDKAAFRVHWLNGGHGPD